MVLFDQPAHAFLYPFTYTRSVADIRMGILTMRQRWQLLLNEAIWVDTLEHLRPIYPAPPYGEHLFVNAAIMPDASLVEKIKGLHSGQALYDEDVLIACRSTGASLPARETFTSIININGQVKKLSYPWQIFQHNAGALQLDYQLLTAGRQSHPLSPTNNVINAAQIFIEQGTHIEYAVLNATDGPIYIGNNATVMEGSFIRGPFSLGENAVVKMGAKIYGATTIGPHCTAGGEIKNSVMFGYSNKAHDGYLGDSVIGEWCNFGAGTSNSNVKNTGAEINMWVPYQQQWVSAGNKCGVLMGDYSRTAINTSINTGSVIGICCNVFGEGFTPRVLPDFTWGITGLTRYEHSKALRDIANWKKFKQQQLTDADAAVLKHIFEHISIPMPW
ncbi:putative sugar nucleotidyl transferase [Foetidibacter luteolus]|uniref:putative sugar nucleotidyl transferase n=1 Tax=Foetidibacter luteolus TaxID=2608880 RepID=UPI00129ADCA2|nr:putative sugar nucleotidyl transferase [Foetidibacter luteolus]